MLASPQELLAEFERRIEQRKFYRYKPYPWQAEFHAAGASNPERMLMAANRVGKTRSAAFEVAAHLTGKYPSWWTGRRFDKPTLVWCGSVTNESSRDIVQRELLGDPPESFTGMVPGDCVVGKPTYRQAGVSNVVDAFRVRHVSGGISTCVLKTYEQGWRKWQGVACEVVWLDEEPKSDQEDQAKIFTEALTRTLTAKGVLLVTFTPLLGKTELVMHFMEPKTTGIYLKTATWDEAPHLEEGEKQRLKASYPVHEADARTKGIPMMGEGAVFPISEDSITCDAFETPPYWAQICGVDFGIAVDHPFAYSKLAHDRDNDVVYVTDCFKVSGQTPVYHAAAIRERGDWIPVSWPHDGLGTEKGTGEEIRQQYLKYRVNLLSKNATYDDDRGNHVEPGIIDMYERMRTGRWKVFRHLHPWLEEFRRYHRKDGKIVKIFDDAISSSRYALMMLRYAAPRMTLGAPPARPKAPRLRNFG